MKKQFFWLLLAGLFLSFFDRTVGLNSVKARVSRVLYPLQVGVVKSGTTFQEGLDFFLSLPHVYRENVQLKKAAINCQKMELDNLILMEENAVLRQQLGVPLFTDWKLVPARVIGFSQQSGEEALIIQGDFEVGRPLVLDKVLIGEIIFSGEGRSRVRTIYSPQSRFPVEIITAEGSAEALAEGKFTSEVYLTNVLVDQKVAVGDLVITSGIAGKYPRNLLVGEVGEIFEEEGEVYKTARLKIPWGIKDLNTVFVLE